MFQRIENFQTKAIKTGRNLRSKRSLSQPNEHEKFSLLEEAQSFFLEDMDPRIRKQPGGLDGENVAKLFHSLAHSKVSWSDFGDFLKILLLSSIYNHHVTMSAKDVCNTLWSLAKLGFTKESTSAYKLDRETIDCLVQTVHQTTDQFIPQTCSSILWSFASLDLDYDDFKVVLPKILSMVVEGMNQDIELMKHNLQPRYEEKSIYQLKDFLSYYWNQLPSSDFDKIVSLAKQIQDRMKMVQNPESSLLHLDVEKEFKQNCSAGFESEYQIAGSFVDICFPKHKVVFPVNGPKHYNRDGKLNSHSLFRDRVLTKCGYKVFNIDYRDWKKAKELGKTKEFILGLIHIAGLPVLENIIIKLDFTPNINVTFFNDVQTSNSSKPIEHKSSKRKLSEIEEDYEDPYKEDRPSKRGHWAEGTT